MRGIDGPGPAHERGMKKPVSLVLIHTTKTLGSRSSSRGLNAAARSLRQSLGITFSVTTAREALAIDRGGRRPARRWWRRQAITLNQKNPRGRRRRRLVPARDPLSAELDVYIMIAQEHEERSSMRCCRGVDGYFYREELGGFFWGGLGFFFPSRENTSGMYRILNAQIQERARTPFYEQLKNYVWMAKDSCHPGHSSGEVACEAAPGSTTVRLKGRARFRQRPSVRCNARSLMTRGRSRRRNHRGQAFGGGEPFFERTAPRPRTNSYQDAARPGEKLLLDRNCHKSGPTAW